ncbi:hypothetical protein O988_09478, partial [Pseudogymnoascus sp. VKM F-3808]
LLLHPPPDRDPTLRPPQYTPPARPFRGSNKL